MKEPIQEINSEIKLPDECLDLIEKWIGEGDVYLPEVLFALEDYGGLFDDAIIKRLIEKMINIEAHEMKWIGYATGTMQICKRARNTEIAFDTLAYIHDLAVRKMLRTICYSTPQFFHELNDALPQELDVDKRKLFDSQVSIRALLRKHV